MYEWQKLIQTVVDEIDRAIAAHDNEALTLRRLAAVLGYSEFHATRKFREISGMCLRDYLRGRKLAFALKEVRDGERNLLDIACDYGFSSQEAFTRAFREAYGVAPGEYRKNPTPVVLRTKIHPFDRYFLGLGEIGMVNLRRTSKSISLPFPRINSCISATGKATATGISGRSRTRSRARIARRSAGCSTA